ncbi:MAG TPA: hypothetical protein ENK89_06220 [Desulfobulbaceae bacterium]|nr:hypothetical protein [Desulfobulbaceae bacterium]
MAKCTLCNARKGKRKCRATGTFICSLCCGENRNREECAGCSFSSGSAIERKYQKVPRYSTEEMADSPELEAISNVIETALCEIWVADSEHVDDRVVAGVIESALDHYHFGADEPDPHSSVIAAGYQLLSSAIREELDQVPAEKLVKVLAAVYRSIRRRTNGGCSYLNFISNFTGVYPGKIDRPLPKFQSVPGARKKG